MRKTILIILLSLIVAIGGIGAYIFYELKVPISESDQESFFEVKEGESTLEIATALKEKKLIRSSWIFALYTRYRRISLLPGLYYLRPNMVMLEIIDRLVKGNVQEYKITIPEGWTVKQIGEYLEQRKIVSKDEFISAAKYDSQKFPIANNQLPLADNESLEGYLFPDTYRISAKTTSQDIIEKMRENFAKRTNGLNVSKNDLILASIVEREAKTQTDRQIIAGIYGKRLELGMKLESCPTVLYAMGMQKDRLSVEDTKFDSPYNTYLHRGLPPGPISNPGLESIKAALGSQESDYLYFLSDEDGNIHYAKTLAEHNFNKEKYGL